MNQPDMATADSQRDGPRPTLDLLELFWRRRWPVFWCTLLGIVAATVYCLVGPPVYESTAQVLVVPKRPHAVTGDRQYESAFDDYIATHLAIIASPVIIERAMESANLPALRSFEHLDNPGEVLEEISEDLVVGSGSRELGENRDSIMSLAYYSHVAEDTPIVLQALLDSYEAFHHEIFDGMTGSTVDLISQARDLLQHDLTSQEDAYSDFLQTSPLVSRGTDEVDPLQDRLTTIEQQRSELLLRRAEVERQLLSLEQARQEERSHQELVAMVSEMRQLTPDDRNPPSMSTALENQLIQLIDDEQRLLEHYGPNHPHVVMLRQRIEATRRFFALPTAAHIPDTEEVGDGAEAAEADPVAQYTQYLQQELARIKISEDLLTDLYEQQHGDAKEHSIFQLKNDSFQRNIERTEALYDVVINRLQEASLVKDFGGFETSVIASPQLGYKIGPSKKLFMPIGALVGLLLGCGLALVVDIRDDSLRTPEQVQQQLGVPVIGQIPQFRPVAASRRRDADVPDGDPMLCTYYEPRSITADSFRALRTGVFFSGQGKQPGIVQVVGASLQDGGSTVAANLAVSLAAAGKRVLLVDADLHQPKLHAWLGLPEPEAGWAQALDSETDPAEAICPTGMENLSLLPAGPGNLDTGDRVTSERFARMLSELRSAYDHVLIDTQPLLVSSDPSVIATQVDGVVVALRLTADSRHRARRAKDLLDRVDATILGVVVNRMTGPLLKQYLKERHDKTRSA